jgi:hypothetical protein
MTLSVAGVLVTIRRHGFKALVELMVSDVEGSSLGSFCVERKLWYLFDIESPGLFLSFSFL